MLNPVRYFPPPQIVDVVILPAIRVNQIKLQRQRIQIEMQVAAKFERLRVVYLILKVTGSN